MASVADLVNEAALHKLAGDSGTWEGGLELAGTGAVRLTSFEPLSVLAEVDDGGGIAEVELTSLGDELFWTCTCPDGVEGRPCRHFVAAAHVAWEKAPTRPG
jgi:uncharacterized Zn finger protein